MGEIIPMLPRWDDPATCRARILMAASMRCCLCKFQVSWYLHKDDAFARKHFLDTTEDGGRIPF